MLLFLSGTYQPLKPSSPLYRHLSYLNLQFLLHNLSWGFIVYSVLETVLYLFVSSTLPSSSRTVIKGRTIRSSKRRHQVLLRRSLSQLDDGPPSSRRTPILPVLFRSSSHLGDVVTRLFFSTVTGKRFLRTCVDRLRSVSRMVSLRPFTSVTPPTHSEPFLCVSILVSESSIL